MSRRGSSRITGRRVAGRRSTACGSPPIRGWVLERLRQETTGEELLVSRDELARIVREQVEAALRKAS
jgi:hypothetical protein